MNPRLLQVTELDARLPEDWRLEIAVKDAGTWASSDLLIGATVIDLENRLFSSPLQKIRRALFIEFGLNKKE